jgi:hypothetical protein
MAQNGGAFMPSGVFINPATGTSPLRWKIV